MDWHRLFGLLLTDYFTGLPFVVEIEKDLSLQQQFLDVVILRRGRGRLTRRLPDGLNDLGAHNLVTFKSHQEALDDWALKELTGHYVNYRKQVSRDKEPLLPESAFRLYAVCSRYPHNLANEVPWETVQPGVYRCRRGTDTIQVVVAGQLSRQEHNAPLHLFSASAEQVSYGAEHYQQRSAQTSTLLDRLFQGYQGEGVIMPYTMEDFKGDYILEHFKQLSPDQQQQALRSLSPKDRREVLRTLSPEDRREVLRTLSPEELLAVLSVEEIEQILEKRKSVGSSRPRKSRRKK
jgi:hypothetical protein